MGLPPSEIPQGAIRFNTDSQKLEFYAQDEWWNIVTDTPNLGISTAGATASSGSAGARGVFAGGYNPATINTIQYVNIASTGNSITFGNLSLNTRRWGGACASSTRAVFAGGANVPGSASQVNDIEFVTIASTGNSTDFSADLTTTRRSLTGLSNATRGLFAGGYTGAAPNFNTIDYITIASTGTIGDFGDLSVAKSSLFACASPTRGIFAGGSLLPAGINVIEYVTISTVGNTTDFGDLTTAVKTIAGACSNATRGIFAGGYSPTFTNLIEYISIATLGNAVKFGELTTLRRGITGMSSPTRAVFSSGTNPAGADNTMDYVTILTQGNAVDFGDASTSVTGSFGSSNAHGGL